MGRLDRIGLVYAGAPTNNSSLIKKRLEERGVSGKIADSGFASKRWLDETAQSIFYNPEYDTSVVLRELNRKKKSSYSSELIVEYEMANINRANRGARKAILSSSLMMSLLDKGIIEAYDEKWDRDELDNVRRSLLSGFKSTNLDEPISYYRSFGSIESIDYDHDDAVISVSLWETAKKVLASGIDPTSLYGNRL